MKSEFTTGSKKWSFAAGNIPFHSTGMEPAFTSNDRIAILNINSQKAEIIITIYYEDQDEVTDYKIIVGARRVRKIRFNDLIDPLPITLGRPYGFLLEASVPVVVQFTRMNTGTAALALLCTTAYHE
jgi:hypothetical protein